MDWQHLREDYITERIGQIIGGIDPDKSRVYYKEQDAILENLDKETRRKCEDLIDNIVDWSSEECRAVYKAAFLEGLWLGHQAF